MDYKQDFDDKLQDESFSDGELLSIARDYIETLQEQAGQNEALLIEAIANYMVVVGCAETTSGNRIFSFEGIADHFHITLERLKELEDRILDSLYGCSQVCGEVWTDGEEFNVMFYGNYCDVDIEG